MTIALIIPLINFTKKSSYPQDIFDFSYFIELITSFASTTKNWLVLLLKYFFNKKFDLRLHTASVPRLTKNLFYSSDCKLVKLC